MKKKKDNELADSITELGVTLINKLFDKISPSNKNYETSSNDEDIEGSITDDDNSFYDDDEEDDEDGCYDNEGNIDEDDDSYYDNDDNTEENEDNYYDEDEDEDDSDEDSEDFSERIYEVANENNLITENIEPIVDGIIDSDTYWNANKQLLFVLKEPYDSLDDEDNPCGGGYSLGGAIQENYISSYQIKTYYNIVNFSYSFLNGLDYIETNLSEEDIQETFDSIAIINLSKMPNHTTTKDYKLWKYYNIWRDVLLEQIDCFNPDYIFFGNTLRYFAEDLLDEEDQENVYSEPIFSYGNQVYINENHPSIWEYDRMELMLKVLNSIEENNESDDYDD